MARPKKELVEGKKEPELAFQIKKVGAEFHIVTIDVANENKVLEDLNLGAGYNEVNYKAKKFFVELIAEFFDENK